MVIRRHYSSTTQLSQDHKGRKLSIAICCSDVLNRRMKAETSGLEKRCRKKNHVLSTLKECQSLWKKKICRVRHPNLSRVLVICSDIPWPPFLSHRSRVSSNLLFTPKQSAKSFRKDNFEYDVLGLTYWRGLPEYKIWIWTGAKEERKRTDGYLFKKEDIFLATLRKN